MKRCPKCSRTFTTDTQKFCTHDGGILEGVDIQQPDTVRMDSTLDDEDTPTKVISAETVIGTKPDFDPFKTVISSSATTTVDKLNDTQGSLPRPTSSIPAGQSPSAPLPGSGQISQPPPQSPAPPPPRQSSPSAPTMALTGTAPIMTASVPPPPPITQQSPQPSAAPPVKKKSRLPLVLGILAVLFIFGGAALAAAYWFVARPMLAARRVVPIDVSPPPTQAPSPNIEATPGEAPKTVPVVAEAPPYTPPADAVQFVNSKEHLSGQLAEHYVDFSFYYPERWQKDPTAGVPGARNFAQVERRLPPDFTQENFAVAWNSSAAPVAENRALFHTLAENLGAQFAKKFPGYHKVSEGETKVGVYDAYEFRFEGESANTAKGDLKLWGRVVFLPPQDGGKDGVTLLMLATSLATELKSVNDVGVKGDLPMLLDSFRFGKK